MKSWALRIVTALALLLLGYVWGNLSTAVVYAQHVNHINIPKDWGPVIGTMPGVFILQDSSGTIRTVTANTGKLGEVVTRN